MTVEINGKTFQKRTGNVCSTCSAATRYMYVKMVTSSKDVVLECAVCEDIITVSPGMVKEDTPA